jgi:hypothetical protein
MWFRRSEPRAENALVIWRYSDGPALKQRIWNGGKTGFPDMARAAAHLDLGNVGDHGLAAERKGDARRCGLPRSPAARCARPALNVGHLED